MSEIPQWAERLAKDLEIIADGLEGRNQRREYDAYSEGYIDSHRVCAEHIREHARRAAGHASEE